MNEIRGKRIISVAIVLLVMWIMYSIANVTDIRMTEYTYSTNKVSKDYRILFISDSHYGAVQDTDILKNTIDEINSVEADIVILGGDIVERGTSYSELQEIFSMLGSINNKYGIFYVYGNHDSEVYNRTKICSEKEFLEILSSNGIQLLCDDVACINSEMLIIGRDDLSHLTSGERERVCDIANVLYTENYFKIVVDHRPVNMVENAEDGMDMQISGHTHAGQIFPINLIFTYHRWPVYGRYVYDRMNLIVSSGQGVGSYAYRNLQHCEYVVINLSKED